MITIKFPKSPRNAQRERAKEIGRKLDYSEDNYDSIIKANNLPSLGELFDFIGFWKGIKAFLDDEEVDYIHLRSILECIEDKIPFTNTKWFGINRFTFGKEDISSIKEDINNLNNPKRESYFEVDYVLDKLKDIDVISVITYKKEYKVEKDKFKQNIVDKAKIIKQVYPKFDESEAIKIIDSFPNKIIIKERAKEEEEIKQPEGEEWVDWYSPTKFALEVRNLLIDMKKTLDKIEQNTRKTP